MSIAARISWGFRVIGLACTALLHFTVQAQAFPDRAVTLVVAYGAGSPADITARALADDLAVLLKQPVIVENRVGGNQIVAASSIARAPANGYSIFLAVLPSVTAPSLQATLPYKALADFAPIAKVSTILGMLGIAPDVPANNLKEFIELLRANPGKYSYGSSGIGSPMHLFVEKFNADIGAKSIHVPYRSVQPVLTDLMGGRVSYSFMPASFMEFAKAGKIKALGFTGLKGDPDHPTLPTMDAAGLKGFEAVVTYVVVTTKGTPPAVIARLNGAINTVTATPAFAKKVMPLGGVQVGPPLTPAETGELIAKEEARWNALVKTQNIVLE